MYTKAPLATGNLASSRPPHPHFLNQFRDKKGMSQNLFFTKEKEQKRKTATMVMRRDCLTIVIIKVSYSTVGKISNPAVDLSLTSCCWLILICTISFLLKCILNESSVVSDLCMRIQFMDRKYPFKGIAKLRLACQNVGREHDWESFSTKKNKGNNSHDSRPRNLLQQNFWCEDQALIV